MASIGGVPSTGAGLSGNSTIGLQDFLKILISQLSFQDPLKPMDNQQFMAQMAQFTALEQSQQLNTKMDALLSTQAALQSVGLIGRTVDVTREGGTLSGTVVALSLSGPQPSISVRDANGTVTPGISLNQITAVRTTT
ncbi:flagellar hook capping protein [Roseateles sp. DAIF2]|uniref:flagellar hook assembly protein FlgD n=1 Tax=Roseateles sp. DAIF2 TaxID=2714952 RepID=UPI0018A2AFF9|nr:flagellar hook capping FlgD N-terminal domain-containing protein [Roseateles sp. DAIF2]QPF74672.1 flagellar hook capping protein [Roseateles sp. DAIF2]